MKMLDNNIIRDMTEEEIEEFLNMCNLPKLTETEQKALAYDIITGVAE